MMKRIAILAAAGLVLGLAACNKDTKATDTKAAPAAKAAPGAVSGDKAGCCKDGAAKKDCGSTCTDSKTSPGAVSGEKAGCCKDKSGCSDAKTSPGAVSGAAACPGAGSGGTCPFSGQKNG